MQDFKTDPMPSDGGGCIWATLVESFWDLFREETLVFAAMQDCLVRGYIANVQQSYCMLPASVCLIQPCSTTITRFSAF